MITISGYRIERTLGKGGMATVYLAIQESFEREVALKILSHNLAEDETFSERFLREAKIVSRLVHPNIVTVYDVGIDNGHHFLSMEYIPGKDLKQSRQDLSLVRRIQVVKDIARALQFAGKKGYVHRDVKPENIMLHAEDGRAVLMDFGIARPSDINTGMTQTGTAIGTPHYMSPEQARGHDVDPRSDLYSLGVVLFLLLAGHVPYDADSAVAVGIKHVAEPIPLLPSELQIFQSIINRALSKDPQHRYQSGDEFVAALETISESELREIEQLVQKARARGQAEAKRVDTEAPTLVSEASVVQEFTDADEAVQGRVANAPHRSTREVIEADAPEEAPRSSAWPWLTGLALAAGIGYLVYFQQQLPVHQRTQVADAIFDRVTAAMAQVQQSFEGDGADKSTSETDQDLSPVAPELVSESSPSPSPSPEEDQRPVASQGVGKAVSGVVQSGTPSEPEGGEAALAVASKTPLQQRQAQLDTARALTEQLPQDLTQGGAIVDIYSGLLGKNPTDIEARQGLQSVRQVYETAAREALKNKHYDQVDRVLEHALVAFPLAAEDPRFGKIRAAVKQQRQIDQWLADAERYLAENALSRPEGANALHSYQRVLEVRPAHALARQGVETVIKRLVSSAEQRLNQGQWQRASQSLKSALAAAPEHPRLLALQDQLQRQRQVRKLSAAARRQRQQGNVFTPPGNNALSSLRKILTIDPRHAESKKMIATLEQGLVSVIEEDIRQGRWDDARAKIARALSYFPNSQELSQLKDINEQAIWDASQPRVDQLRVSHQVIAHLHGSQSSQLPVDGLIYVGFAYANFGPDTSVVKARLYEEGEGAGQSAIEVAQVPVIVTRNQGEQFFRFEAPLQGFPPGRYRLDLWLEDQALASASFEVVVPVISSSPAAAAVSP